MRVAIVGCGGIANTHASALINQKQTLALCVGTSVEKAKAFAQTWNMEHYSDRFEDALGPGIDCIHICTPPTLHYEMAKAAMLAGKHVVCEKPLCLDSAQAKELWELSQKTEKLAAVNYNVRYHDACQSARKKVQSGDFGKQLLIHGSYMQQFSLLPCDYMWRYIPAVGGKMRCVTEIGSHWFDLIRFITALEIIQVSADFGKFFPNRFLKDGIMYENSVEGSTPLTVDSEDTAAVMLRFNNGAKGVLLLSQLSHGRSNRVAFEISSAKQSIWWNSEDPLKLHTANISSGINTNVNAFAGGFPDTHASFFNQIYTALENGEIINSAKIPNFYDGYKNAAICEAVYESATHESKWTEVV